MLNISWKSQLSSGLAAIALVCIGSPVQAQSVDRDLAAQLADIAFGYAQVQQLEKAIALLEQAETYEGGDCFEAITWLKIGVAYQAVGDQAAGEAFLTQAAESATEKTAGDCYSSATSPTESFLNRAAEYAEAGHLDLALQLTTRVDSIFEPLTLAKIAAAYAEVGQRQKAEQVLAESIADQPALVARFTQDNSDGDSILYADRILIAMIGQLLQLEQPELAAFVIEQSELVPVQISAPTQSSDTAFNIYNALSIARLLAELEQPQQALSLLDSVVPNIQLSPQYPFEVFHNRVEAAQIYHQLDSSQAIEILAQTQASLAQLSDPQLLSSAQVRIVRGYAEIGEFDPALALAESIDSVSERQTAYEAIAAGYAKAGLSEEADSLVESIGNPRFGRVGILRAFLETEQYAQAEQLAQQPDMIEFLAEVGRTYCEAGLLERAVALIEQSPAEDWLRGCVATELAKQGEFERALDLAQPIEEPTYKAQVFTRIAVQSANPTAGSRWQRLWRQLSAPWQRWFGTAEPTIEILDQALNLIQPET